MCTTAPGVDAKSWALAYQQPMDGKKAKGVASLSPGSVSGISYSGSGAGNDPTKQSALPSLPGLPSVRAGIAL